MMNKTAPWGLTLIGYNSDRESDRFSVYVDQNGFYWTEDPDYPGEYCPCYDENDNGCEPC